MQGVIKEGITLPFVFSIKYTPNDDSPNLNPQTLTIKQTLTSNENGDFTSDPISLKGIKPGEIKDDQIEIFVKTDTSLRKKLGAISIISTNNRLTLISKDSLSG